MYGQEWDANLRDWENPFNLIDWIKEFLPSDDELQVFTEEFDYNTFINFNYLSFKGHPMSTHVCERYEFENFSTLLDAVQEDKKEPGSNW